MPKTQTPQTDTHRPLHDRSPYRSFFPWKLPRPLLTSILMLGSAALLQAQEPFEQDIVPIFNFSESYVEELQSYTEDGFTDYLVLPNTAKSKITVAAKVSATGVDFSTFDAETPFVIAVGTFEISGLLGDDPAYKAGATSVRVPITYQGYYADDEEEQVGLVVISWNDQEINASVVVNRPDTYQVAAGDYMGTDAKIQDTSVCRFTFGTHELTDRTVYMRGESDFRVRRIGTGPDAAIYEMSTVKLAGSIDSVRPTVRVVGLRDNAIVGSSELTLNAVSSDNIGVIDVQVQVNDEEYVSLVESEEQPGRWSTEEIVLNYGTNILSVKAIDEDGNESLVQEVAVRYWAPLTVNVSGRGVVTRGFAGTSLQEPGAQLAIRAVPADGFIFAGWTGGVASSSPLLSFEMQPGLALTANFIPNPFTAVRGSYTGLLAPQEGSSDAGSVGVLLTGAGTFTAKIGLNGLSETLAGAFDSTGHFTGTLNLGGSSPYTVDLQVGFGGDANAISGTISDGTNTFSINSERSTYTARNPAPQAGYYTVVLPAGDQGTPQGDGYATLSVAATGAATLTGALADGTPFSYGGMISRDGTLGVYFPAYGSKGTVFGKIQFRETANISDLDGTLSWIKAPAATADGFYSEGFNTSITLAGARYKAPRNKQRVISLVNAKVILGEGGIETPIEKTAVLNVANRFVVTNPAADKLNLNVIAPHGVFTGTFIDSTGAVRKLSGVFLQKQNLGAGVFRGANTAGYISITAP